MFLAGHRRVGPGARLAALAVAVLLAAFPAAASAASGSGGEVSTVVPGDQSAGDQYVETLPTARGPRAPGRDKHAKRLSRGVAGKLERLGGSDAATLKALATSPALGAPAGSGSGKGKASEEASGARARADRSGGKHRDPESAVPSAAIKAVDGGDAGLGWLVLALLAITALSLGAVGYRRRRDNGSAG
jgi:hypothetical protein